MINKLCLGCVLLASVPALSQLTASPAQGDARMQTPPAVSGEPYPALVGTETRSNFLRAGLAVSAAYDDDVLSSTSVKPTSDFIYTIQPTIALDQTTERQQRTLTYSPGFTLYQRSSSLNAMDQAAGADFQFRLSPYATIAVRDQFRKSANVFSGLNAGAGGAVTGSGPVGTGVLAPYADQLRNTANVDFTYQYSLNSMIGAGGTLTNLDFPSGADVPGLYSSSSRGGSAFYSHRMLGRNYLGGTYQYEQALESPKGAATETDTHSLLGFYTFYFRRNVSLSLSGGAQYSEAMQSRMSTESLWGPAARASVGWQAQRFNVAASYAHQVTAGGGLLGAFHSNSASLLTRWQAARRWTLGAGASYSINKSVAPQFSLSTPGGHSISGTALVQHAMGEHFNAEIGYARLHQSYSGVAVISSNPDSDREYVSITYQFTRPLGR